MSVESVPICGGCTVGVSHCAKCGTNRSLTMRNANKMSKNPLFRNGEETANVILNPHSDPDHQQKLITSIEGHL